MTPPPEPPAPPPVSPTGTPVLSPALMKFVIPVVAVAGGIALAPTLGVDVSFLPPIVPKAAALVAFLGMTLGVAGPGIRKTAPMVLLVLSLGLTSCAHAPPTIVITARSMQALNDSFVGTAAAMDAALDAHHISPAQYAKWSDFGRRFQASCAIAEKLYDAAAASKDDSTRAHAEAVLRDFEGEMAQYAVLALQVVHPDGGP